MLTKKDFKPFKYDLSEPYSDTVPHQVIGVITGIFLSYQMGVTTSELAMMEVDEILKQFNSAWEKHMLKI